MKKHIPNFLTSMNVLCGSIACVMALNSNYFAVICLVCLAAIFDFFDGFAARLLKSYSPMGKELDSLADMVSFGLAPTLMVFNYLTLNIFFYTAYGSFFYYLPYICFLLVIFSALRLAKFNIDERQSTSFIGLPTPANALFWISLIYSLSNKGIETQSYSFFPILIAIIIFSLLLTAEIPMFSLKVKSLKLKGNELRYALILFMIGAIILFDFAGISLGIIFYIFISILNNYLRKKNQKIN